MTDILNTRNGGLLILGGLLLGGYAINEFSHLAEKGMDCGYNSEVTATKYGTVKFTKTEIPSEAEGSDK